MAGFKDLSEAEFAAKTLDETPRREAIVAESAKYDARAHGVASRLTNGISATFPLAMLPGLAEARPADLRKICVEGRGYGLHIPALDADISVAQLFADHLASDLLLKPQKRQRASQANGRLGGRPRKTGAAA